MDIFFDTPVLIAAFVDSHPQHAAARAAVRKVVTCKARGYLSTHSIAELYAALTSVPVQPPIHPMQADKIIRENVLPHFTVLTIGRSEYLDVLERAAANGWRGTQFYDALLLRCANECHVDQIYTFHVNEFRELADESFQTRIMSPGLAADAA